MPRLQDPRLPPVQVVYDEYEHLADIICSSPVSTEALALLWSELLRAAIIQPRQAPYDLVRMNSVVRYTDLRTGARRTVRLVYPKPERLAAGDVAVTSILGAALLGLRAGATFSWVTTAGDIDAIHIDSVEPARPRRPRHARRKPDARRRAEQPRDSSPDSGAPDRGPARPMRGRDGLRRPQELNSRTARKPSVARSEDEPID